jgi:ATP-dependent helicase/nuclease subunit A
MEMLAEEMRVLYVALTRAREKLILLATVKETDKLLQNWSRYLEHDMLLLPDDALAKARSYLDWIGPALMRHPDGRSLREHAGAPLQIPSFFADESSRWFVQLVRPEVFSAIAEAAGTIEVPQNWKQAVLGGEPVDEGGAFELPVADKLSWRYGNEQASSLLSKTSVTELKRLSEHHKLLELLSDEPIIPGGSQDKTYRPMIVRRPRFMEQTKLNAAERGTVFHSVMQHMPLNLEPSEQDIRELLADMVHREMLTQAQSDVVEPDVIVSFFRSALGQRLLRSNRVHRELPFSYGLPAKEVYGVTDEATANETVMLQGVIDCIFEEENGLVLLDYKTDRLKGAGPAALEGMRERYRMQLDLYAKAVERIWKRPVTGKYIFLFDGAHILEL